MKREPNKDNHCSGHITDDECCPIAKQYLHSMKRPLILLNAMPEAESDSDFVELGAEVTVACELRRNCEVQIWRHKPWS